MGVCGFDGVTWSLGTEAEYPSPGTAVDPVVMVMLWACHSSGPMCYRGVSPNLE